MTPDKPSPQEPEHWAVDRKIPLAIIGTVLVQTIAIGWWTSKLDSRVGQLELADIRILAERAERRKAVDDRMEILFTERNANGQRYAEMKTQIDFLVQFARRAEQRWDGLPIPIQPGRP